jgi:sugar lactone lactonase YvrE
VLDRLARPQGMAFAPDGTLWVAASYRGKRGVFKYFPDTGDFTYHVAAPMLVGLAISREDVFLVDSDAVYWLKTAPMPGTGT